MLEIRSGKIFFIGLGQVQEGQNHANLLFHSHQRRAGLPSSLFALRNYGVLIFMLAFLLLGSVAWGQADQITPHDEGISHVFVSETSDSNKSSSAMATTNSEIAPLVEIDTKNEFSGRITNLNGANRTHIKDEALNLLVSFSTAPVLDMTNGTPYLDITVGSTTKQAAFVANLGLFLQFAYTITDGDSDLDGVEVNEIVLNGSTIRDSNGLDFDLTLPANANSALTSVLVDGIVPSVTSVAVPSDGTYNAGNDLDFTVNYTEPVSVTGTPQLSLIIGSTTKQAIFQTGSNNTNALLFRYTVQSGDEDTDGIAVGTLTTDGATLLDGPGNSAGLVLANIGSTGNVKVDAKSPEVNSVTVPADGTYTTGQDLDFTVNYTEPVSVTGTPQLSLTVGSATKQAVYQSGSGSTALLFRYTVQSGDEDTDGITVGTLAANGGTLQDGILQDANLALNNVGTTTNINVDAVVPTVTSVAVPADGTYTTGQNLDFTVNFDEAVTVTGTPQLSLTVGSATKQAVYQSGSGSTALLFRYTAQSGDEDTDGIALGTLATNGGTLQDGAGNGANLTLNNAGTTTNINVDARNPEVSSVTVPADGTYGIGSHLDFTVNFDEVVTVTGTPQLALTVGSTTKQAVYQSGSGSAALLFRYTVQSGDEDTNGIAVGTLVANGGTLQDGLLNDANLSLNNISATTNIKVNHLSPIFQGSQVPTDGTYTLGQALNFSVTFDKGITANTTNGIPYLEVDIGGNIRQMNLFSEIAGFLIFQYHVQTNDLDVDGIRVLRLVLNGAILQDGAGNDADISGVVATDYPNLKVDGVVPAVTSVSVPSDGTYTAGQDLDFTVNFDDVVMVTGTPQLSLTVGSATKQGIYQSGSGSAALLFRYTVQSGDADTNGITVGTLAANGGTLQDGSGNDASLSLNNVGATTNINVDAKGPEVVSVTVPADGTYTTGQDLDFIVNFNEVVVGDPGSSVLVSLFSINQTGSASFNSFYSSGIGTNALTFRYTVQAGDQLNLGDFTSFIMSTTGLLRDALGNTADRTLNSFGDLTNVFIDAKAPELDAQTSSPTDGAANVTLSQNLSLAFDDNMVMGTGNITIVETGVGNFEQLDVTNGSLVTVSDSVVTLNPSGTLKKATAYHLLIDGTALDDDVSNSFAGVADPTILNFSTVDVVINEIVTDPQQDWSSTNFASTPSSGSSGTDDEWVELFIKSQGIDLTGWTIELLDGSDVVGDLSSTGAFDVSNYTSSGSGTFTNTAVGDYLVLGNVASSGALNNTGLTINLKDPGGAIVDVATVGVANPTPFPGSSQSGNSNGVNAESVQRFANGSDTDIDFVDFTFGPASIAAANTGPSVTLSIDNSQISETGTATITATRSANSTQTTTVAIDVKSGGEALDVTDFTLSAKTITIPNGSTTGTVTLTPVQDALFELDENTTIEITSVTNGIEAGNQEASLLILNSDAQPVIAFSSTSSSGDESTSSANLEVTLSAASGVDATVNFTVTGTATNVDYNLADGSLTIPAGSTSLNITIASIIEDALDEVDETVIVTLSGAGNATLGTNTVHTYTITDNDPEPTVNLTVDNASIAEAAGTATLTATLSAVSSKDVTVNLGYTGTATIGTDFNNTVATSIVITAGNLSASASPIITAIQDVASESDETIIVDISGITNGTENGSQQQTVTIIDDDAVRFSVDDPAVTEGNAGTTTLSYTVSLNNAASGTVTVDYATSDGTATAGADYTALNTTTLTFAAGETSKTVVVSVIGDQILEGNETINLDLSNATGLSVIGDAQGVGSITNDDAAAVTIADVSGAENGGAITVTATLDNAVQGGFTVDVNTADGTATTADSDYTAITSQTLTFAGTAGETQTFTVTPTADTKLEADETLTISLSNLSATILSVAISNVATVTITNDDAAAVTIADVSGAENGGAITVTATLDNAVQGGFTVDVNTADGTATTADSDYTSVTSQTLTFAGTAGETQTFTVTPTADDTPEANETIQIIQSNLASTVLALDISNVGIVTIINDDDGIAPIGYTVTFDDALIGGSEVTTSKFTFAGAEVGTTYNYAVSSNGGGTNVTGSGTIITATDQITLADLSGLTDGTLTLSVTLTDPSSNVGAAVTAITSKDATAPASPVVSSITTDSGANGADGITNDNTLSFNGTAEANATVEVFIDATSIGTTTADATGQWSFNHETATLTDATYVVTATATDAAGNATSSSALNVTVDTAAPSAPVVDLAASSDSGVSSTDNLTSDNTPTFIGTAEVNAIIEVFINGNSLGTTTTDGSGNWSITVGSALGDGVNSVTARATDTAGNSSAVSSTLLIVIDTVVPVDPVVTSPAAVTVNAATQTISGTHPDNGATVHVYADADNDGTADNTTSLANAVISGSVWSLTINLTADSDNNFVVKAIDGVANESSDVDVPTITEDSTVPADPVVTIPASIISLNATSQSISGTHAEDGITVHAYADADNDGTADNATSLANAVVSGNIWSLNINLTADSDNNFVVKAIDGAGNESGDVDVPTITEDSTVPADPVVTTPASAISLNAATQTISGAHTENGVTVHVYADADNDGTADNTTSLANAVVSSNAWSLSANLIADSDNNYVVKATDGAGNESGEVDVPTITEDSTIPTITNVTSSTANGTYGAGDQVSIQVEFSEAVNVNGTGLQLGLETGLDLFVALASGSGTSTLTFDLTIPVGHKTSDLDVRSSADLTITSGTTVKDAAGNSASLILPTGSDANSLATNKNIIINSEPTVTLSVDNSRIDEATGTATLTATLSAASPSDVTVTIAYSGTAVIGTDYNNTTSTTITVIAGQVSADAAVIITPVNDINPETNETIIADITGVTNGTEDGVQQETITIVDDDSPSVSFATSASNGAESTSSTDLTVNTTIASALTVTVDYTVTGTATGGGTDYTLANGTLTFNPGSISEIITIAGVVDDAILEANETVIVTLSNPANANLGANILHTYTITDNDAAALTIADVSGAENGGAITVTATLDNAVQGGFTVDASSADGTATTADSDYTAITSQTLTFAGTAGETQTFIVTPTADTKLEADETLTISQANLSATTLGVAISDGATVTITNDDAAAVTFAAVSGIEDVGAITVTATLDNAVQGAFTVDVSTADGTATLANNDYTAITSQTLTFAGTAGENQTFTVAPIGDSSPESIETVLLNLSNLVGTLLAVDISAIGTVTILDDDDGTAPSGYSVTMDDGLIGGSELATSKFTFTGAEAGATYNYTVSSDGGGTNVTGTGTITTATDQITIADLSGLSDGTLTLSVTLTDPSSNVGAAVTASTSKDATAPAAPVVSSITTDSGASASDRITNDNALSFNGTAEANATVEVFIDAASIGSTTADATGQWSFNHETTTLTDANYAITATATDAAGNTSSSSTALSVTIDTAAPSAPVVSSITNDTGANGTDQSTNDPTLSFDGTAQANSTVEVFIDAVSIGTTTADGAGQWSFNHESTTLSDASYSVTAKATDVAGNTSAESAALTVTVDTTVPAAPTIDLDASFDTGTSDSDNLTNATTLKFNGTAEANADIEVFINDVSFGVTVADVVGAWTLTTSPLTLTGDISVKVVATDQVSNTGPASDVLTVTIDTELALPTLLPADNATDILPTTDLVLTFAEDVIKSGNTIEIRKSSDDSILESFDVSSSKVTVSGSTVTIDLENTLPPATEVYVTIGQGAVVDNAGNDYAGISTTTDWSFTTIAASVVSSVAVPTADTYGIGDALDFTVTMVLPVTITGTATIPVTIGSSTVNATQVGTVSNSSTITFRYTVVEDELDTDGIAVGSAINLNGGTMKDAFDVDAILTLNNIATTTAVLVDGVRPTPTITNANTTDPVNGVYTVLVEFDEPVAGFSATDLTVSNGTSSNFTNLSNDTKWSFDITPTADGTVSVSLAAGIAIDNAGNASVAGAAVSKTFDGTPPEVSSITRKDADQLNTATTSANFRVVFSEDVLGVDLTDFEVTLTGTTGALNTVTAVDAKTYDVNVNGISGQGTIGLNVKDDDSILDNAGNKIGGTGLTNGDFTGDVYTTNFLPTDIISMPSSISENNAIGDIVGALTSTDADTGDSHTYILVSGAGDTDNSSFSIDGTNLKAEAVFDFETKDSYSIRVKTDDGEGGTFEKALTITIDNVLEPSILVTGDATFDVSALGLSQTRTLTVTNNGEKPVEVRVISTPTGFRVLPGSLILTTGASTDVVVTFIPTEVRTYSGNIVFNHEGGNEVHPVSGEGAIITSVDDGIIKSADIDMYPNPASRQLTIDLSALSGSKLDITVVNSTGMAMFDKRGHTDHQLTLNVSGYEMGVYIVQFTNGQSVVSKKVIIKR